MPVFLFFIYFLISIFVFLYSYGFVDFNLTLTSNPQINSFVIWSQSLALFNRPLSTSVYLVLITLLYLSYLGTLLYYSSGKLTRFPWKIVVLLAVIFALSYPFLSSDVFKYLFVGKIIVHYQANPYLFAPQEFAGDLWLRFMRWIHTTTPYGPVFSAFAVPYYLLAAGKFVPMLYLFKLDQVAWYLLATWLVGQLSQFLYRDHSKSTKHMLFFALNPLVLVEWLVNSHNDAIMITLLLLSLYLLVRGRRLWSFIVLLLSIGIKYVTVVFLPFLLIKNLDRSRLISILYFLLSIFFLAPLLYHYSYQYQPWYVTWLVPLVAIIGSGKLMFLVAAYTLGAFLRYLPFISIGLWEGTSFYFAALTFLPLLLAFFLTLLWRDKKKI